MTALLKRVFFVLMLLNNTNCFAEESVVFSESQPIAQSLPKPVVSQQSYFPDEIRESRKATTQRNPEKPASASDKKMLLENICAIASENYSIPVSHQVKEQFEQGSALIHNKNYEQALPIFSKLTDEYSTFPEPYNNLAFIYAAQGNYLKAQEILQAAFKNNPRYALVFENLNLIYAKIAQDIYEKAIDVKDNSHEPLKNLYLIEHICDTAENKTTVQDIISKEITVNNVNNEPDNSNATSSLLVVAESISTAPSEYTSLPKYIFVIILLLTGGGIGLTIKEAWHFLVNVTEKNIREPKALKIVDFSHFFGDHNTEIR